MEKNNKKCGPNAMDHFEAYTCNNGRYTRSHYIDGTGAIKRSYAPYGNINYSDFYTIEEGITELCDECFNHSTISSVILPKSLKTIGNKCFTKTKITKIVLPKNLKEIGHYNFPSTLLSINIPSKIKNFHIDNLVNCDCLNQITVDEDNLYYKSIDGVLYNYDMTEILFWPNAKRGKVIIPNTVTRIGEYCFYNCKNLESIIIPSSVVEIGDYAFQNVVIKSLSIPNSVKKLGIGCFYNAKIEQTFKFCQKFTALPDETFKEFYCPQALNFLERLEIIGTNSFNKTQESALPETISLNKAIELQTGAFEDALGGKTIELFSSLKTIGERVFDGNKNMILRFYSYAPIKINDLSLSDIANDATLVVPKGTKLIYENASGWRQFLHIKEWDAGVDKDEQGKFVPISEETYYKRLQSLANSKRNADRYHLKEIISELAQNLQYVNSDTEYEEAVSLIRYNKSFIPAIVPYIEKQLCKEWSNKYKLRIIEESISDGLAAPMQSIDQEETKNLILPEIFNLSLPERIDMKSVEGHCSYFTDAYFNQEILKHLQNTLTLARTSVKIAVAWFTNYSLFKQVKQMARDGIRIQLIINNDLINNGGYCLDFNELINAGIDVSLVEYPHLLHHKFLIIDNNYIITGSYNWTRFSAKNYENMVIINDAAIIKQFCNEFDKLLENAEYKHIDKMPDIVPERQEYDRSAFKQYITEELDALASESTEVNERISALKRAYDLNHKYLAKINPSVLDELKEEFKVIDDSERLQTYIINTIQQSNSQDLSTTGSSGIYSQGNSTSHLGKPTALKGKTLKEDANKIIEKVKASGLIMVLDVSGSMEDTYSQGHVHQIARKAMSAALAITDAKEVIVWTFGTDARYIGKYGISQIKEINNIGCKKEGTFLDRFVKKANDSIEDGALCIIFTDDDSKSITIAVNDMKQRENVFWQIIVYESDTDIIKNAIKGMKNASVVNMTDYQSKTDEEQDAILLKGYLRWKTRGVNC